MSDRLILGVIEDKIIILKVKLEDELKYLGHLTGLAYDDTEIVASKAREINSQIEVLEETLTAIKGLLFDRKLGS